MPDIYYVGYQNSWSPSSVSNIYMSLSTETSDFLVALKEARRFRQKNPVSDLGSYKYVGVCSMDNQGTHWIYVLGDPVGEMPWPASYGPVKVKDMSLSHIRNALKKMKSDGYVSCGSQGAYPEPSGDLAGYLLSSDDSGLNRAPTNEWIDILEKELRARNDLRR